ncbi:MAG: hypothetical protein IJJ41_08740 [Clostridia bacterium]|nr:hypothetical protein [Clostridia bacterium]
MAVVIGRCQCRDFRFGTDSAHHKYKKQGADNNKNDRQSFFFFHFFFLSCRQHRLLQGLLFFDKATVAQNAEFA